MKSRTFQSRFGKRCVVLSGLLLLAWAGGPAAYGLEAISGLLAAYDDSTQTNDNYATTGGGSADFPVGTTYRVTFGEGSQNNLHLTGFEIGGESFNFVLLADIINLERVNNVNATGRLHIVLYEDYSVTGTNVALRPDFAETMMESLRGSIVNRGADNVFANTGDGNGNNNNIERIDYIFPDGFPVFNNIDQRGFLVMDRGGNDRFKIAAILAVDASNRPTVFGDPVSVLETQWGDSGISVDTTVMRGFTEDGDVLHPSAVITPQPLAGVYVTWQDLGLQTNDYIYGYSLAGNDVSTNGVDWTNVASAAVFPTNTSTGSEYGGLDLISGGMMFFEEALDVTLGNLVWDDWDGDGIQDAAEPGLANVLVQVYDASSNLATVTRTDDDGTWLAQGIGPGTFFVDFTLPAGGYQFTLRHQGTNAAADSDADVATGRTDLIALTSSETNLTIDAGMHLAPGDLRLAKSVWPTDAKKGDPVVYTIGITNAGLEDVSLVQVTDVLPSAVAFGSYGATTGTYSEATGIWDVGNLAAGAAGTLTITGTVNAGYGGLTITNSAAVSRMDRPDTNWTDNADSATFTIQQTDLAVLKTVDPAAAEEGVPVEFTIALANNGPRDATGIEVTDLLPAGFSYGGSVASQGSYASGTGIWTAGAVTNGGSATLVITATPLAGTGGTTLTNVATIGAASLDDAVPTNDTAAAELPVLGADLGIGKRADPAATAEGQPVVFTIALTNHGPAAVTGVAVSDPLMTGVSYVSNAVSQGSYDGGSGTWTVGALAADAVATLEIYATVDAATAGTVLTNTATITTSSLPDPDPANDAASATVAVSTLRLDKTSDVSGSVQPGGTITYTIIVTNYGAVAHTNVALADAVPDGTTYVPDSVAVTRYPESPPVPTTVVYAATTTFTAPAGVTSVTVSAWGGGGGGATRTSNGGGGGGGGGGYSQASVAVLPGSNYVVNVGGGGAANTAGGDSWFSLGSVTGVLAKGGGGGVQNNANGAAGGAAATGIGDVRYNGGNGANGVSGSYGGGGGSSAGTNAAGTAAVNATGAVAPGGGGNGGNGRSGSQGNGTAGTAPGGAGGGGLRTFNGTRTGGAGAAGRVVVSYEVPTSNPVGTQGDPPNLATGWWLDPGQALEATFQVVVDDPLELMAITNTAYVTSEIQTIPLMDTIVDPFVPVDLGVGKAADPAWVGEGGAVKFAITVTNLSAGSTATGVELTDLLPAGFNYVSNAASQGSYASGTGLWTVGSLSPLATATLEIYATAAAGSGGLVWTNTVDVSALDQTDLNPANDAAQAVVGVYGADLAILKTVDRPTPNEGDALLYSIVVTNRGPSDTTGVSVSEPLTNGVTYVSNAVSQGSYASGSGLWTVGDLAAGESATLWIAATVDAGTKGASITNWSRITTTDMPDPDAANDQDSAVVYVSALIVTKTSDVAGYAVPGSNVLYTIVVSNSGASTHSNLLVTDLAPSGTTYVADSLEVTGPNWTTSAVRDEFNAQAYTNNDGALDWNAAWQEGDPSGTAGPVGNYVGVTTGGGQLFLHYAYVGDEWASRGADLSDYASAVLRYDWQTVNLAGGQTVSVLVSTNGADPFVEVATYSGTASGSEEIDVTSFLSTNTTVRFENLSVNWNSGDYGYFDNVEMEAMSLTTNTVYGGGPPVLATNRTLRPGETLTLTFEVTVDNPCGVTQIVNTVSVISDQTATNVTATASDPVAYTDLALVKTVDETHPAEGAAVTYTIVVTNKGPALATGLEVTEPLTNGLIYVSDAPSQGTYDDVSGVWNIGSLAVGATANLTITADVATGTAGTSITNLARVSAMDQADPTPGDNQDTAVIAVEGVDVGVGKSVAPAVPVEKEQLVYTVSVTNFGPDEATGVVVTDLLPAGLTYVSAAPSQGTYDAGTGEWIVGALAASQVETLAITALVKTNTAGTSITNSAVRTATDQVDTNAANDSAAVVVEPTQAPLDIFKTVDPAGTVGSGDTLTYTILVTNHSAQAQTGVDVTDTLPGDVTYVPGSIAVTAPITTNVTILDLFSARSYGNNNGTTNWFANWVESEGDGPTAGNVQVLFDTVRGATFTLRFAGAGQTMVRQADLSGKSGATLSFDYRRDGLEAGEYVAVQMSSNGTAGAFTEIGRLNGAATDAAYSNFSYDVGAWISTSTAVRFVSPAGMDATDILWIDDVQIETERRVPASVPGGAPPALISDQTLLPGEAATLTFDVTVNAPIVVTQLVNSVAVTSDQMTNPRTATAENPVDPDWATVGGRVWFDANGNGVQNSTETNGVADIPVALMDTNGTVVAAQVTSAAGLYLFDNLVPGTYYLRFDLSGLDTNYVILAPALAGGDPALDSDATDGGIGGYAWTTNFILSGGQTNLTLDLGLAPMGATRAELAEVWGEWRGDAGFVAWRTASEWDTAGFRVYRVDPETGAETRLNEDWVLAAMCEDSAEYALAVPGAEKGATGFYRLEEAELTGGTVDHGTHKIRFAVPPPSPKAAPAAQAAPRDVSPKKREGPSSVLKVLFRSEGLYGVSLQALADGMGLALEDVQGLAENNDLIFTEQGEPVPVIYDAANGRMAFHGQPTDNWYVRDNAILIEVGEGLAMARREPGAAGAETVFPAQVRFEEDLATGNATMLDRPADWYYWKMVTASVYPASNRVNFAFDLAGYAGGPVTLTVDLLGWTRTDRNPDHRAEFFVNGIAAGSLEFDDQRAAQAVLELPEGVAVEGVNTLTVRGALPATGLYGNFVVDGFTAVYSRRLEPGAGTLHFRAGGAAGVSAAAYAAPLAVALNDAGVPAWIADESGALPGKAWAAAGENERFAVVESAELPLLVPEPAAADAWFLAADNRIDYLIVSSRALAETAQALADYRAGQGLRAGVAVFEDACDLLTGGLRTPEAIPELLAYAQATWAEAPWLVVLAGNGHYDYLGVKSNEVNHLPPLLLPTKDGLFAADGLLADTDGDGFPDAAVGRLPARNAADLAAIIAKIRAFEVEFGAAWQDNFVLANDTDDPAAGTFAADSERLADLTRPPRAVPERINLNKVAIAAGRATLLNWFKNGAGFIHYTGHGGAKNWSAKNLLKDTDVQTMVNSQQPVVIALTCFAGRYEMPAVQNLGEALLLRAQGGAVAVWSPSGASRNAPAIDLAAAFYRAVFQEGCGTLGLAIRQAQRAVQNNVFSQDTLAVYNLLGDPALRIAGNRAGQFQDANFAQWRWQRFAPAELADPDLSGPTARNFFAYALAGDGVLALEPVDFEAEGEDSGIVIQWRRRIRRDDVEYRFILSEDLRSWASAAADLEELGAAPDPDGVMETVRTRIGRPDARRVFVGILAVRR